MGESKQGQRIPELRGHLGANVIKIVFLLADAVSKKEGVLGPGMFFVVVVQSNICELHSIGAIFTTLHFLAS